jgi:hypothetical protein
MPRTAIAPGRSNAQQSGQCEGRKGLHIFLVTPTEYDEGQWKE